MVKKQFRSMKVQGLSGYNYKETPGIMLKGQWLKEAGFEIGRYVQVKCEDGKLIISLDEGMRRGCYVQKREIKWGIWNFPDSIRKICKLSF